MRMVSELNQQNAQLQDELKTVKNDLKVANIQVDDLKKLLEELRSEMLLKVAAFLIVFIQLVVRVVGWASGRSSGLCDKVLAWLSVWSEVHMICIWSS